ASPPPERSRAARATIRRRSRTRRSRPRRATTFAARTAVPTSPARTCAARVTRPSTRTTRAAPARRRARTIAALTTAWTTTTTTARTAVTAATTEAPATAETTPATAEAMPTRDTPLPGSSAAPGDGGRFAFLRSGQNADVQRKRTVLLVEDEPSIAEPLAEAIAREGFETRVAGTVAESLALAAQLEPDLVLLDVMLPDGSGFDVCRELRQTSPVPILMLTARGEEADRVPALRP